MNLAEIQRTLTNNPQAAELIAAVKDLKPVEHRDYAGCMEYWQADSASYAALIAKYGAGQEPPKAEQALDLSGYVAFMAGILLLLLLIKKLCQSSAKSGKIS